MGLTVQDDNGSVAGANAYITVEEFKTYHADRGNAFSSFTDPQIASAIVRATDYLDQRFSFVGQRLQGRDQSTEWPRYVARGRDDYAINGIPVEVKEAVAEYALRALSAALNPDPERGGTGAAIAAKSESVGPISDSVTYVSGSVFTLPKYPAADQRLIKAGLTRTGGTVLRG